MLRDSTSLLPYNGTEDDLVLGAGFSRAISSIFPTLDQAVCDRVLAEQRCLGRLG